MEEIEQRLKESTQACIKSFENWVKENKSLEAREDLMETMHEVRKVVARVEIEIAISERDRLGSRPIPIPPHRSSMKQQAGENEGMDEEAFDMGGQPPRAPQGGGGRRNHQQGRGRRPMHGQGRSGGGSGNADNAGNTNTDNNQ